LLYLALTVRIPR